MENLTSLISRGQDPSRRTILRYQNLLNITGRGTITFGIWSVVRWVLYYMFDSRDLERIIRKADPTGEVISRQGSRILVFWLLLLVMQIDLGIRMYIGRSAIAESRGRKKKSIYLGVAALYTVMSFISLIGGVLRGDTYTSSWIVEAATFLVDLTAEVVLVELVYAACRLRWHRWEETSGKA